MISSYLCKLPKEILVKIIEKQDLDIEEQACRRHLEFFQNQLYTNPINDPTDKFL